MDADNEPTSQVVKPTLPEPPTYVPRGLGVHADAFDVAEKLPGGHTLQFGYTPL